MKRGRATTIFAAAEECLGSHDDFPIMPEGTDPMSCVSRNRVAQPFFLVSEHDQILLLFAGQTRVELHGSSMSQAQLKPGESLYIPAGQPSRIVPLSESVQLKWRAEPGGWEAAVWFCAQCDSEVFVKEFNTSEQLPQECYWAACNEFNSDAALRTCEKCGTVLNPADLDDIRWPDVARQIRNDTKSSD